MSSSTPRTIPAPAPEGWRIVGVVAALWGGACFVVGALPWITAVTGDGTAAGAAGLLILPLIPVAPLCSALCLFAGGVGIRRRDTLGISFAAVGLALASSATALFAGFGAYGVVLDLWDLATAPDTAVRPR